MAISYQLSLLLGILVYYCTWQTTIAITFSANYKISSFNHTNFPKRFLFGSSSAAYQYEGAVKEDGKGTSMWDIFTHKFPEKIKDHSNGDVADDSYNRYKKDVKIMKDMGFTAHRFSISWSRILPNGKLSGGVNKKGVNHYNNFINELLANGIVPFITLFHFDLPQALEDEYGGFLSPHIVNDFKDFTDICFKEFGDRVKHWITINEPLIFSYYGYGTGSLAPGRCSTWMKNNCNDGNSGTETYLVAHHLIIAHATVVQLYKTKYQEIQKGIIGISLPIGWAVPYSKAKHNLNAAKRVLDFTVGWFMEPFTNGHYPHVMQIYVGDRLPKFSKNESKLIKGSFDFIGVNYYTSSYAIYAPQLRHANKSVLTDHLVNLPNERDGVPIGPKSYTSSYVYIYPSGIYKVLQYMKKKYQNPRIYITENGIDNNATLTLEEALDDKLRLNYYYSHLHFVQKAIRDGVNVKGYFAWSLLDNFEWASGFTSRFGLNFVDYKNGLKRYPKLSAQWFKNFLTSKYPQ